MFESATLEVIFKFLPDIFRQQAVFKGTLCLKTRIKLFDKLVKKDLFWTMTGIWRRTFALISLPAGVGNGNMIASLQ